MKMHLAFLLFIFSLSGYAAEKSQANRKPSAAGQFWCSKKASPEEVASSLNQFCDPSKPFSITANIFQSNDSGTTFCCVTRTN